MNFNGYVFASALLCSFTVLAFTLWWPVDSANTSTDNSTGPRAVSSLKQLIVISRHGNRRSDYTYANDPYPQNDTKHWNYGLGQLTTRGRVQLYTLGRRLRVLYAGFLSAQYYTEDLQAASTAKDRTMMSGQALLAGLFPPVGFQRWNADIFWQPIPIYSSSPDKSVAVSTCARFQDSLKKSKLQFAEENSELLEQINNYLTKHAGENITGGLGFHTMWDIFSSEDTEGFPLPSWASTVYPQPMANLSAKQFIATSGTDTLARFIAGPLMQEMVEVMQGKRNGTLIPDRRMFYYSGHDTSIVALQGVLNIPKDAMIAIVKVGSAIIFELHQDSITREFSVQVLYIDASSSTLDPVTLDVPACGSGNTCSFDQFLSITQRFRNITDWNAECQLQCTSS